MKTFISFIIILTALLSLSSGEVQSEPTADQATVRMQNRQTATATVTQEMGVVSIETEKQHIGDFLIGNWGILSLGLLSFLEVVTRLTPSEKDNTVLSFLSNVLNAIIPNIKKGGGRIY